MSLQLLSGLARYADANESPAFADYRHVVIQRDQKEVISEARGAAFTRGSAFSRRAWDLPKILTPAN